MRRLGALAAPVARMGLTPGSHALDVGGVFAVITVGWLGSPALLAGGFAGLAALRLGAVGLALDTARVGNKVSLTLLTLTMRGGTYHGPDSPQVHDHDDGDGREEHAEEHRMGRRAK